MRKKSVAFIVLVGFFILISLLYVSAYEYEISMDVYRNGVYQDAWVFGMDSQATDDYDDEIDKTQPPPPPEPPESFYNVYFEEINYPVGRKTLRTNIKSVDSVKQWRFKISVPPNEIVNITWIPPGQGYSKLDLVQLDDFDQPTGVVIDMLTQNSFIVEGLYPSKEYIDVYRVYMQLGCVSDEECDDGLYCNGAETCVEGGCQEGISIDCADDISCSVDSCNEELDSCENTADDSYCDDNNACNGIEKCSLTEDCLSGTPLDCNDGISCTLDSCDAINGCQNEPDNKACDDGIACTDDICNELSGCQNVENNANCLEGEVCRPDLFSGDGCGVIEQCTGKADGTACDDGLYCNGADECQSEECINVGPNKDCSQYNLPEIATCSNNPDNNPFTWDSAAAFTSTCDEEQDACTQGSYEFTHACDVTSCGAECESNEDISCPNDACIGNNYADYPANGVCNSDCSKDDSTQGACSPNMEIDSLGCKSLVSYNLQTNAGINFISIPLILENNSIEHVFSGVLDKINRIYSYGGEWEVYYGNMPRLSSLKTIEPGKGYVLFTKQGFERSLNGYTKSGESSPYTRPSFNLNQGWNLFGTFSKDSKINELFADSNLDYKNIFEFDKGYKLIASESVLTKDKGYWIYINSSGTFNPIGQ